MMKKNILVSLILLIPVLAFNQVKLVTNTYLYGDIDNVIKGNILINSYSGDPKYDIKIIKRLKLGLEKVNGISSVKSWNSLFLPNKEYHSFEIGKKIRDKKINTIIILHQGTSGPVFNFSSSNTNITAYGCGILNAHTQGFSSGGISKYVDFTFDIYTINNGFTEPVAQIKSKAVNCAFTLSRIVNRFCKAVKKHN